MGNRHVGKQRLSIGSNCDRLATVEHEFLHALGFWHEQSRADRDDYVSIMWDQIEAGDYANGQSIYHVKSQIALYLTLGHHSG